MLELTKNENGTLKYDHPDEWSSQPFAVNTVICLSFVK